MLFHNIYTNREGSATARQEIERLLSLNSMNDTEQEQIRNNDISVFVII
jgi:hypothetical protein